jgi:hypothetical protein
MIRTASGYAVGNVLKRTVSFNGTFNNLHQRAINKRVSNVLIQLLEKYCMVNRRIVALYIGFYHVAIIRQCCLKALTLVFKAHGL